MVTQHVLVYSLLETGFCPALYYKATTSDTTNDRCWDRNSTGKPKRNNKERVKETNADNDGSPETEKPRDCCAHRRTPTKLLDSETLVPINTSKKGHDNDDAAAKEFPRYAARGKEG